MTGLELAAFTGAFFVFAASPGPDNVTIVARTLSHGPRSGLAYGLGTVTGILLFLIAAAFGLGAMAQHFGLAFELLRYGGAAYLVWAGVSLWCRDTASAAAPLHGGFGRIYLTGVALNLGNPKMPLFYIALLPAFFASGVPRGGDLLALAAVVLAVEAVVIGGYILLAWRARHLLARPRARRLANRAAAGCMVGAGIAAAAR